MELERARAGGPYVWVLGLVFPHLYATTMAVPTDTLLFEWLLSLPLCEN